MQAMKIAGFLALVAAALPSVAFADIGGTYSKKNSVAEIKQQGNSVEFSINSSANQNVCELEGVAAMIDENRAAYTSGDGAEKCVAVLNFSGGQLVVTTKGCEGYCGLNAAGSMDGSYKASKGANSAPQGALVSDEKAFSIAGDMYKAYRYGGASEMLAIENSCWSALHKQGKKNEAGAASCSVAGLSGAFVEGTIARSQRRSPTPIYSGDGVRGRILKNMAKAGIDEAQAQQILEASVQTKQGSILSGLSAAGMR